MRLWILSSPEESVLLLTNVEAVANKAKEDKDIAVQEVDFSKPLTLNLTLKFDDAEEEDE